MGREGESRGCYNFPGLRNAGEMGRKGQNRSHEGRHRSKV